MNPRPEDKSTQLEKILHSRTLNGSETLKSFLRFVVQKAIDGEESQLRESLIATKVFGRQENYDSRTDSVVRVQAGRLRAKLSEYYADEGQNDPLIIDLPKGGYSPTFQFREIVEADVPEAAFVETAGEEEIIRSVPAAIETLHIPPSPSIIPDRNVWLKSLVIALGFASLSLGLLAIEFRSQAKLSKANSINQPVTSVDMQTLSPLWGEFFKSPEPVLVAFSNTVFQGRAETGMKLLNPLDSTTIKSQNQESVSYSTGEAALDKQKIISDHYTGVGEVMSVYFLSNLFSKANHPFRVKRSLLLTWEDVKAGNIVVLGSPAENFIMRELPQQQDFVFRVLNEDKENPLYGIVNLKPKAGEQSAYTVKEEGPSSYQITEDYALISLLKGLDEKHRLMIIAGIKTYGTQAATEYVTNPEYFKELLAQLKKSVPENAPLPDYFQVLLKVKVNGGVPVQTSYVTHHVLN